MIRHHHHRLHLLKLMAPTDVDLMESTASLDATSPAVTNAPPTAPGRTHKRPPPASQAGASSGRMSKKLKRDAYRATLSASAAAAGELPKKKFYRQRAHANPFSDHILE